MNIPFSINRAADLLERDRQTLVRALRHVPPDAGTPKRPLYRLATVVKELVAHEAKPDGRHGKGDEARLAAERACLAREQTEAVALKNAAARFRASVPGRGSASAQIKPRGWRVL
jgi:phage terminase Nu1 subunit (DNA packaging protein)